MKKLIFTFAITLLSVSFGYSQTYTNLGGHLNVKDNIWTLDWLNNNYKILEDHAVLVFESKSEVEEFYNDMNSSIASNDANIIKAKYRFISDDKFVMMYNSKDQLMVIPKKYSKISLKAILESIDFIK